MFCFDYFKNEERHDICEIIEKTAKEIEDSDNKKFKNKTPRKTLMTEVERLVKGAIKL